MKIDKNYCMSSYLTLKYVENTQISWDGSNKIPIRMSIREDSDRIPCSTAEDVDKGIRAIVEKNIDDAHIGLLLSGGIDSGILASYVPAGTKAYTMCNSSPSSAIEVNRARRICEINNLEHIVVNVSWQDYDKYMDELMCYNNCPVSANEPQVYALMRRMNEDGIQKIFLGDDADMVFGGMNLLLSKDWTYDEWKHRYTFVEPARVLRNPIDMNEVFESYRVGEEGINYIGFMNNVFRKTSGLAYVNPASYLNLELIDPYSYLVMADKLDLERVRAGESKYILRELYKMKYPGEKVPEKLAMERDMKSWLSFWDGPKRSEFISDCIVGLTFEQRFMVYSLERFLNIMDY